MSRYFNKGPFVFHSITVRQVSFCPLSRNFNKKGEKAKHWILQNMGVRELMKPEKPTELTEVRENKLGEVKTEKSFQKKEVSNKMLPEKNPLAYGLNLVINLVGIAFKSGGKI